MNRGVCVMIGTGTGKVLLGKGFEWSYMAFDVSCNVASQCPEKGGNTEVYFFQGLQLKPWMKHESVQSDQHYQDVVWCDEYLFWMKQW